MPRVLLTIGCEQMVLPDGKGIEKVLALLSRGILVEYYLGKKTLEIRTQPLEIRFQNLPDDVELVQSRFFAPRKENPMPPDLRHFNPATPLTVVSGGTHLLEG